jgi:hypothetical protein
MNNVIPFRHRESTVNVNACVATEDALPEPDVAVIVSR